MDRPWLVFATLFLAALPLAANEGQPSHRPIENGLDEEASPEEVLAARLRGSRDLKEQLEKAALGKRVEEMAKQLLHDPKFLKSMKGKFTPRQLRQMKERFQLGQGLADNPELRKLLKEGAADKLLDGKQRAALREWRDRQPATPPHSPGPQPIPGPGEVPTPTQIPTLPPPAAPPRDDIPEWVKDRLTKWTREAEGWATGPSGQGFRDFLTRLAANRQGGAEFATGFARRASGLGKYLPRVSEWMPRNMSATLPDVRVPSFAAGLPSARAATDGARTLLIASGLLVLALLLWRGAGAYQAFRARLAAEWRLGPWPVAPGAVQTRTQLIQAYEHLALLLLGRSARAMSHVELARGMARQPDLHPGSRDEAAHRLAASYEQARYAPPQDELSDEQLAQARQQLAYLAGSSGA